MREVSDAMAISWGGRVLMSLVHSIKLREFNKLIFGGENWDRYIYIHVQVVVLASLAQLLVFVELARCARSVRIENKDVICM